MRLIAYVLGAAVVASVAAQEISKRVPGERAGQTARPAPAATSDQHAEPRRPPPLPPAPGGGGCYPGQPLTLAADRRGHFLTEVEINGSAVPMVIDTGASVVTLPYEAAARIGLDLVSGPKATAHTANGAVQNTVTHAYSLRLGPICLQDVAIAVTPPGALNVGLLGMNVIGKMSRFELSNSRLVIAK